MTNAPSATWRVLVADDEPAARRGVRQLLARYPQFTVVGECRDGHETLAMLHALRPEVLFLDIQMPEVDGFEVLRRLAPERRPATVFLTAHGRFAIRAFETEAHDYLVKPVSEARFAATMERLASRLALGVDRDPTLVVPTTRGMVVISLSDIEWIEAADNYVRVRIGSRSYLLRESLTTLERRIGPHGFARAHRRALVRVAAVKELRASASGELVALLASGARVPISRRRRHAFTTTIRDHDA